MHCICMLHYFIHNNYGNIIEKVSAHSVSHGRETFYLSYECAEAQFKTWTNMGRDKIISIPLVAITSRSQGGSYLYIYTQVRIEIMSI